MDERETGIWKKKRKERCERVWKCGSREEKSLDWQMVVWLFTDAFPPFAWSAENFNLRGPGTGGGCGLWVALC